MNTVLKKYDLYLNTRQFPQQKIAECVLKETSGMLVEGGFRYMDSFISHKDAFPLDPVALPLQAGSIHLACSQGLPGFLDDYLPDAWGAKVLVKMAYYRDKRKLNQKSPIDMLSMMGNSRIGALAIVEQGSPCEFSFGAPMNQLHRTEEVAHLINDEKLESILPEEFGLVYLAHSGSGVGGARPKSLIFDEFGRYLAKYNQSPGKDPYNNARVELACMQMAKAAGIEISTGKIIEHINGRDVLIIERFDLDREYRHHLITLNALMKNPMTQSDHGGTFTYDGMYRLLAKYSTDIATDGAQLLKRMFFNTCIHNLDDHERNFSLIHTTKGYRLSPAYDMVPSVIHGAYPVAGFRYNPVPPRATEYETVTKEFGLSKPQIKQCAEEVISAIEQWGRFAEEAGVSSADLERLRPFIKA